MQVASFLRSWLIAAVVGCLVAGVFAPASAQGPGHPESPAVRPAGPSPVTVTVADRDGATVTVQVPYPLLSLHGAQSTSLMAVPAEAGRKIDGRLLDVRALAEEGLLSPEGTVPVLVRSSSPVPAALLQDAEPHPLLGITAGEARLVDLPALATLPDVERVQLDGVATVSLADTVPLIRADLVHQQGDGAGNPVVGSGVVVAIVDTGVDYGHGDLGGCFGAGCKVEAGYDYVNDDADPMDDMGHGTHVAATAAGAQGVAPGATLHAYKVCNEWGSCPYSAILSAIEDATLAGADIISMSLGGPGTADGALASAVDWAVGQGVVVVSAAGNSGAYGTVGEPAAALRGIAVGATTKTDGLAYFSSRGPVYDSSGTIAGMKPDVAAPGVDVVAAVPTGGCFLCDPSGYLPLSGTSMATPHVSGAAALLLQAHPAWTPDDVKGALMGSARLLGYDSRSEGAGRIDAYDAWAATVSILPGNAFAGIDMRSEPSFAADVALSVRNLGASTATIGLAAAAAAFGATVQPANLTLAGGESGPATLHLAVDNAMLEDGWWEALVEALPGTGNAAHAKATFVKSSILHLTLDEETLGVVLTREGMFEEFLFFPGTQADVLVRAGTYDLFSVIFGCPLGTVDCGGHSFSHAVVEGLPVDGEASATLTRDGTPHAMRTVARLEDGSVADPALTFGCNEYRADEPAPCYSLWSNMAAHEGFDWFWEVSSAGTNGPNFFGTASPGWSFGRVLSYRHHATTYTTGDATRGIGGDVTFDVDPASFVEHAVVYNLPDPYSAALRVDFCNYLLTSPEGYTWGIVGTGYYRDIPDRYRERFLTWLAPRGRVMTFASVPAVPCEQLSQMVEAGQHEFAWDCVDPLGCPFVGIGLYQEPRAGGTVQHEIWRFDEAYDDRYARPNGDIVLFDGAAGLAGQAYLAGRKLDLWPTYDRTWVEPGTGGTQVLGRSASTYDVALDGTSFLSGELGDALSAEAPGDGVLTMTLSLAPSLLETATGSVVHRVSVPTGAFNGLLPEVAWARVDGDGLFGTAFDAGAERTLRFVLDPGAAGEATSVRAFVAHDESEEVQVPLFGTTGSDVVEAPLPDLGAGAYDVRIEASFASGAELSLEQRPVFVVAGGPVNGAPAVAIESPADGETAPAALTVSGSASDPDGENVSVAVRIDGGPWMAANGGTAWSLDVELEAPAPGEEAAPHTLEARAFDGRDHSPVDNVTVYVAAPPAEVADLAVDILSVTKSPLRTDLGDISPNPPGRFTIRVAVSNLGDADVATFHLDVLATAQAPGAGPTSELVAQRDYPRLEAGRTVELEFTWDAIGAVGDVRFTALGTHEAEDADPWNDEDHEDGFVLLGGFGGLILPVP